MRAVLPLPVALPLLGAALSLIFVNRRVIQRAVSVVALFGSLAAAVAVLAHVHRHGTAVTALGGWPGDIAINLVADRLAALMLVIGAAAMAVVLVYALGERGPDEATPYYHPVYLTLAAGISAAFLAGDLFHLFVAFEVLLLSSFVLITLEGSDAQIRAGTTYVVLNVLTSLLFLTAVGLVYAATATVNMATLPERLAALPAGVGAGLNLLLLLAFGLKAAVFPLFFWLPDSYPAAPSPAAAIFAGLLTKIGVYAMIRTETLLFADGHETLLLWIAGATMVVGGLGALAQSDMKRILSFHVVGQIGFLVFGVGLGSVAGLAATVFYMVHYIPAKTALFLVEGLIERHSGTSLLDRVGGLLHRSGWLALLFLLPAFSLAGLPPFSGFIAKLGLVFAGIETRHYAIVAVSLVGSMLTLVSMMKIWTAVFWGEPTPVHDAGAARAGGVLRRFPLMAAATGATVAAGLAVALAGGPIFDYCQEAAAELAAPARYIEAVLGR